MKEKNKKSKNRKKQNRNKMKRILPLMIVFMIIVTTIAPPIIMIEAARNASGGNPGSAPPIPTPAPSATPSVSPSPAPNTGGNRINTESSSGGECCCCEIIIPDPYETNFRTMQVMDVASIVNEHTESASDYRPNLKPLIETLPEFKMADILEYVGMEETEGVTPRENVQPVEGTSKEHASKLEDLVKKNLVNRDAEYRLSQEGSVISPRVERLDSTGTTELVDGFKYNQDSWMYGTNKRLVQKYERPSQLMSRTDFIVELMKTEEIIQSPPILVRSRYTRTDNRGVHQYVDVEELERSPYQNEMGRMGIDTGQTDVIASHELFGRTEVIVTNDIPELYLRRAYNKGMFFDEEFVKEGKFGKFMEFMYRGQPSVYDDKAPRHTLTHKPMRMFYLNEYPTGKMWEWDNLEDDQYPIRLAEWQEIIQEDGMDSVVFDKTTPIWGEAYDYYHLPSGGTDTNPFSPWLEKLPGGESMQWHATKDWTIDTGLHMVRKRNALEDPENGYGFFNQENISVIDAYMYIHQQLEHHEGEKSFTQKELDFINATYSLEMARMTVEEKEAIEFLIAKGIISGDDGDLSRTVNKPLTNEVAIDLIWRIVNKEERHKITPELSDVDKAMLEKGFKKSEVNINNNVRVLPDTYIDRGIEEKTQDMGLETLAEVLENIEKGENLTEYDLIFVQTPAPELMGGNINMKLLVNDDYRGEIQGHLVTDGTGSPAYSEDNSYWISYIVHKDYSHNLILVGDNVNRPFSYTGINGGGVYRVPTGINEGEVLKWTLDDYRTDKSVRSYFTKSQRESLDRQVELKMDSRRTASNSFVDDIGRKIASMKEVTFDNLPTKSLAVLGLIENGIKPQNILKTVVGQTPRTVGEMIWESPQYLSLVKVTGHVVMGPIEAKDLEALTYKEGQLAIKEDGGGYSINTENHGLDSWEQDAITNGNFQIIETTPTRVDIEGENRGQESKIYTIKYPTKSKQYRMEMGNFLSDIRHAQGTDDTVRIAGYAQLDVIGQENQTFISKAELEDLGIKVISDKILENKLTGQKAFLNTEDNYTLIGNNVTQYDKDAILVNAFGAVKDEYDEETKDQYEASKIFYNLNVMTELLNDTKVVTKSTSSSIDLDFSDKSFKRIPVVDAETLVAGEQGKSTIDFTYLMNSGEESYANQDYINLSAIGGPVSNFIYYKSKQKDAPLSILMTYSPTPGYESMGGTTDNTLDSVWKREGRNSVIPKKNTGSMVKNSTAELDKQEKKIRGLKKEVIETIFRGVGNGEDFFHDEYTYNIYVLHTSGGDQEEEKNNFIKYMSDGNATVSDNLKEISKYKAGDHLEGSNREVELTINFLETGESVNQDLDFMEDKDSGNLFMYMADSTNPQISSVQSSKYAKIFRQNLYLPSGAANRLLRFRQKRFYENTPDNFIPLEEYAENRGSYGSMFFEGGKKMLNFGIPQKDGTLKYNYTYRVPGADKGIVANPGTGGNFHLTKDSIGMFTHLEMPWVEIPIGSEVEGTLMDQRKNAKNKSGENAKFGETYLVDTTTRGSKDGAFARDILGITTKIFEDEINKSNIIRVPNMPEGSIDGDIESTEPYSLATALQNSEVGLDNQNVNATASLMVGTWDGILSKPYNELDWSQSNYHYYSKEGKENISDIGENETVLVLVSGITPYINNRTGGIGEAAIKGKDKEPKMFVIEVGTGERVTDASVKNGNIHPVKSMQDLASFAAGTHPDLKNKREMKVLMKPSIGIPQGTTVVSREGSLKHRPNTGIREEVLYASNIINALVFRTSLPRQDFELLSEIPQGSIVTFPGGNNRKVVKLDGVQSTTNNNELKWVDTATIPDTSSLVMASNIGNVKTRSDYFNQWGNTTIPYNGTSGTEIMLKKILGKSSSKLAERNQILKLDAKDLKTHYADRDIWLDTGKKEKGKDNIETYTHNVQRVTVDEETGKKNIKDGNMGKGYLVTELVMPPTIVVEKNKVDQESEDAIDEGNEYTAIGYYDISGFTVDQDNTYIQYLRDRDTPATNIMQKLEVIDVLPFSGLKFRADWLAGKLREALIAIINILHAIVPIIAYTIVVLINVMWVMLKLPISRGLITNVSYKLGGKLAEELAVGNLREEKLPPPATLVLVSVFIAFIGVLFDSQILWLKFIESVEAIRRGGGISGFFS